MLIPLLAEDKDLPQTARMNAAYTAVSIAQHKTLSGASMRKLSDALIAASEDDDRYVIAAAVEGLKWLQLRELDDDNGPAARLMKKLVFERWCPINSVRAPF